MAFHAAPPHSQDTTNRKGWAMRCGNVCTAGLYKPVMALQTAGKDGQDDPRSCGCVYPLPLPPGV